jgi:hypothetical protein
MTHSQANTFPAPRVKDQTMHYFTKALCRMLDQICTSLGRTRKIEPLTTLEIDPHGRLHIKLNPDARAEVEWIAESANTDQEALLEIIDEHLGESLWSIEPWHIGAMTDSIVLADGYLDIWSEARDYLITNIWWYPNYAVESYTDVLLEQGEIVFSLGDNY